MLHHVIESSKSNIVVVENQLEMDRIRILKKNLPHLKAVIQIKQLISEIFKNEMDFWSWNDLENVDVSTVEEEYKKRAMEINPKDCCCLIYTSGTIGMSKAVMLSHDNVIFQAQLLINHFEFKNSQETSVSYLPLCHIIAQLYDIFIPMLIGGSVYFADSNALKGTLIKTLQVAQPILD